MKKEIFKIVIQEGYGEVIEKKSRFISRLCPVESEIHAQQIIQETKKKYYDAKHVCFAYIVEDTPQILRYSDDGEPNGTAGKPMLDVLLGEELTNVLVLCTRYFGGTLLGTGGLVRAYQQAAKESLNCAGLGVLKIGRKLKISSNYEDHGKIKYVIEQKGWNINHIEYLEYVNIYVSVPIGEVEELKKEVTERTGARVNISEIENVSIVEKDT